MRSAAVVAARRPAYDVPRQRSSKAAFCRLAGLVTLTPGVVRVRAQAIPIPRSALANWRRAPLLRGVGQGLSRAFLIIA